MLACPATAWIPALNLMTSKLSDTLQRKARNYRTACDSFTIHHSLFLIHFFQPLRSNPSKS